MASKKLPSEGERGEGGETSKSRSEGLLLIDGNGDSSSVAAAASSCEICGFRRHGAFKCRLGRQMMQMHAGPRHKPNVTALWLRIKNGHMLTAQQVRGLPLMMATNFWMFWPPPTLSHLELINITKFTQPPLLRPHFHNPPPPLMRTSYLEAP